MKKIFTMAAALLVGVCSLSAQTMTVTIDGRQVSNGDEIVITKMPKATQVGPNTLYDLGVDVVFTTHIAQTVNTTGTDISQTTPGLACCPTGFSCTTANESNGWTSTGTMNGLEAGQQVVGEWIHYNYAKTLPAMGTTRKSIITFEGAEETISFSLSITVGETTIVEAPKGEKKGDETTSFNAAGQRVAPAQKGLIIRNGKKILKS